MSIDKFVVKNQFLLISLLIQQYKIGMDVMKRCVRNCTGVCHQVANISSQAMLELASSFRSSMRSPSICSVAAGGKCLISNGPETSGSKGDSRRHVRSPCQSNPWNHRCLRISWTPPFLLPSLSRGSSLQSPRTSAYIKVKLKVKRLHSSELYSLSTS